MNGKMASMYVYMCACVCVVLLEIRTGYVWHCMLVSPVLRRLRQEFKTNLCYKAVWFMWVET